MPPVDEFVTADAELGALYLDQLGSSLVSRSAMSVTSARLARHAFSRPLFVPERAASQLDADLQSLLRVIRAIPAALGESEWSALGRRVGVPEHLLELCEGAPLTPPPAYGRADVLFDGTSFRLLELGLTPPVGMPEWAYSIPRVMLEDEPFAEFVATHRLRTAGDPAQALREMINQARGEPPGHVVVADAVGAFAEFGEELLALARELERVGFTAEVAEVDTLTQPAATTAWLRMFTLTDFLIDPGMFGDWHRIMSAQDRSGDPFVTTLASEIYNCKGMLAAVCSEPVLRAVAPQDADAVRRLVPPTWMLDSLPDSFVLSEQSNLILKRAVGAGGDGTTAGWTVGSTEWRHLVSAARSHGGYVCQQRVDPAPLTTFAVGGSQTWRVVWGAHYGTSGLCGLSARVAPADERQVGPNRGSRPTPGLVIGSRG